MAAPKPEQNPDDVYAWLQEQLDEDAATAPYDEERRNYGGATLTELRQRLAIRLTAEMIDTIEANLDIPLTSGARQELARLLFERAIIIVKEAEESVKATGLPEISALDIRAAVRKNPFSVSKIGQTIQMAVGTALLLAPLTILLNAVTIANPYWAPIALLLSIVGCVMIIRVNPK